MREQFVPTYDRLVRDPAMQNRAALVDALAAAIDTERPRLRAAVTECVRKWMASVVDDLVAAGYADAAPIVPRHA